MYPNPVSAVIAFLEREKTAAIMRRRQCDKFLLEAIEEEVRNSIYKLRKMAKEEYSIVLRLLSLFQYV